MAFGKFFLLPVMGGTLFGWLTYVLKNLHNFAGPVFAVSLVIVIVTFMRDELPQSGDLKWLLRIGGAFDKSGNEPPSHRFNAGEKVIFWIGVFLLGIIVVGSGLVMDMLIPNVVYERSTMQVANMIHAVAAVLMMTLFLLHIYLGTIGMRGAYKAHAHRLCGRGVGAASTTPTGTRTSRPARSRRSAASRWRSAEDAETARPA